MLRIIPALYFAEDNIRKKKKKRNTVNLTLLSILDVQITGLAGLWLLQRPMFLLAFINVCTPDKQWTPAVAAYVIHRACLGFSWALPSLSFFFNDSFFCISILCTKIMTLIFLLLNIMECLRLENYMFLCSWFNMLSGKNLSLKLLLLEKYRDLLSHSP